MALNVDILSVNSLFINGVDILENKVDFVQLVGDEKIIIDVPSTTYTKVVPQIGVNLGDVELKTTPLDGKTFDTINNAGGVSVDGVSHTVDSVGCYVSNINIDSFVLNKTSVIKSLDYTTYKWHDVDYGRYDLALSCDDEVEVYNNNLIGLHNIIPTVMINKANPSVDDGIPSSTLTYYSGKFQNSARFPGNADNSFLKIKNYNGNEIYTISFWVNPDIVTGRQPLFGRVDTTSSAMNFFCTEIADGKLCIINEYASSTYNSVIGMTDILAGEWNHIIIQIENTKVTGYINGMLQFSDYNLNWDKGVKLISTFPFYMGRTYITDTSTVQTTFKGYIDNVRIFNKVLSDIEVNMLFNETLESSKISNIFNDNSCKVHYDMNGGTSIITNTTDFQSGTASYEFNGTNYITAPSNPKYALGTDDFTIELYAKVTYLDTMNGATLLENTPYNSSPTSNWRVVMSNNGRIIFQNGMSGGAIIGKTDQFNKWCNITVTRTNGVVTLYVNGIKEGETNTIVNFTRNTFDIGRNSSWASNGALLKGLIDDLRITKGLARYTANFTPSTTLDTGTRPVKTIQHQGTIIQSELSYSDYLVSYGTEIDPWVAVQPSITVSGEPFTLIDSVITSSNTFTSTETLNVGDIISSDKETFGTIIFKELDEYMVDSDIFFDGVTDKVFTTTDANVINFVQDKRSNLYTNGLRDALLSAVSSTIYGHINDEIIIDAGDGGSFILGTMYTSGGYNDTDTTSKFSISTSSDGVDYTLVYENQENLMTNHTHSMTGTGRFVKITFLNEIGDWGRIITNIVGGKWWDLHIVHPMSKVYKYSAVLEVNGKTIVPDYIQWFDNMTINKIVCGKVFINPTTVLNITTENISKVELDLWQEVKGVI